PEAPPVRGPPGVVDHRRAVETLREVPDAPVDFAQLPLAVDVVAVLRAIAIARGPRHGRYERRPLDLPQTRQLFVQPPVPAGRHIVLESVLQCPRHPDLRL